MIGKPHKQSMDQKYYVALSYFGVRGIPLEQISVPEEPKNNQAEEMKSSLEENSGPENFAIKLQNLIL